MGFDRTCVVRSMKLGIAYRHDTHDLRLAASSTAQSRDDIIMCELWVFGIWGLGFGACQTEARFVSAQESADLPTPRPPTYNSSFEAQCCELGVLEGTH